MVELLFLASVYSPCPACKGARYNAKTLEIQYREKNIAEVLQGDLSQDPPETYSTSDVVIEMFPNVRALAPAKGVVKSPAKPEAKLKSKLKTKPISKPVERKKVVRDKAVLQEPGTTTRTRVRTRKIND